MVVGGCGGDPPGAAQQQQQKQQGNLAGGAQPQPAVAVATAAAAPPVLPPSVKSGDSPGTVAYDSRYANTVLIGRKPDQVRYRTTEQILCSTSNSRVMLAQRESDSFECAVKFPECRRENNDAEIAIMMDLLRLPDYSPYLVKLLDAGIEETQPPFWPRRIIMQRHTSCLRTYMEEVGNMPKGVRLEITRQLYSGLAFLHNACVAHDDPFPGNVLVERSEGCVKICDLGTSKYVVPDQPYGRRFLWSDLMLMTTRVVYTLWLRQPFLTNKDTVTQALNEDPGFTAKVVDEAAHHFFQHADRMTREEGYAEQQVWERSVQPTAYLRRAIAEMHRWYWQTPSLQYPDVSMGVPTELLPTVRIGNLLASQADIDIENILTSISALVTDEIREHAEQYIKDGQDHPILH